MGTGLSVGFSVCCVAGIALGGCASPEQSLLNNVAQGKAEIIRDHPATLDGAIPTPELLRLYGVESIPFHCYHTEHGGQVGRITMRGLVHVATGVALPPSVLKGKVTEAQLAAMKSGETLAEVAKPFVDYALRVSGNDPIKARAVVEAAEIHDARCSKVDSLEARRKIELAKQNMVLIRDKTGQLVVIKSPEKVPDRLIARTVRLLKLEEPVLKQIAELYEAAYAQLRDLALKAHGANLAARQGSGEKSQNAIRKRLPAEVRSNEADRARHMREAEADFHRTVLLGQEYCVASARPNC